jgi:glycosyltransferase involved in cell wall biosynthesis
MCEVVHPHVSLGLIPVETQSDSPALVTVVVVVYNRLQFLDQAIGSALRQSYRGIQVIVIDDGSSIDVRPVVSSFGDRVEFIQQPNGGVASARNLGIARARGKYVLFLDDDDFLEPTAVENLITTIEAHAGVAWAAGRYTYVDQQGRALPETKTNVYESGDLYERMIDGCLMSCPSAVLVKTELLRAVGGFDKGICPSEDYDLWLALAREHPIAVTQAVVTNYRTHTQQISRNQWRRHYEVTLRTLQKHRVVARIGFDSTFERSIARVNLEFGDSLYVSGDHRAAREQWRKALASGGQLHWRWVLGRFVKSYLPRFALSALRKLARGCRALFAQRRGWVERPSFLHVAGRGV